MGTIDKCLDKFYIFIVINIFIHESNLQKRKK